MNDFMLQHQIIAVLLGRFYTKCEGRVSLSRFVDYLHTYKGVNYFCAYGKGRLKKVISHALQSGAYKGYRLSYGEGIVNDTYNKNMYLTKFNVSDSVMNKLLPKVTKLPFKHKKAA